MTFSAFLATTIHFCGLVVLVTGPLEQQQVTALRGRFGGGRRGQMSLCSSLIKASTLRKKKEKKKKMKKKKEMFTYVLEDVRQLAALAQPAPAGHDAHFTWKAEIKHCLIKGNSIICGGNFSPRIIVWNLSIISVFLNRILPTPLRNVLAVICVQIFFTK